ncbi:MAG TPA: hypothetical protein VGF75_08105 [Candidatus Saccharimonadales bacterium]|jgi:hypothetical protein
MAGPSISLTGSINVPGSASVLGYTDLTIADADHNLTADEWAANFLDITSSVSLTATRNIVAPLNIGQQFTITNSTIGGQAIQIIGATGTGVNIPNGNSLVVYCDGTNYSSPGTLVVDNFDDNIFIGSDPTNGVGIYLSDPDDGYFASLYFDFNVDSPVLKFDTGGTDVAMLYIDVGLVCLNENGFIVINPLYPSGGVGLQGDNGFSSIISNDVDLQFGTTSHHNVLEISAGNILTHGNIVMDDATTLTVGGTPILASDSTSTDLTLNQDGLIGWVQRTLFLDPVGVSFSNTTTPTSIFSATGIFGTLTFPANFWIVGRTLRLRTLGFLESDASTTLTLVLALGGSSTTSTTPTLAVTTTDRPFFLDVILVCTAVGASGNIRAEGWFLSEAGTPTQLNVLVLNAAGEANLTVNTGASSTLSSTLAFSAASTTNSITSRSTVIEQLY